MSSAINSSEDGHQGRKRCGNRGPQRRARRPDRGRLHLRPNVHHPCEPSPETVTRACLPCLGADPTLGTSCTSKERDERACRVAT